MKDEAHEKREAILPAAADILSGRCYGPAPYRTPFLDPRCTPPGMTAAFEILNRNAALKILSQADDSAAASGETTGLSFDHGQCDEAMELNILNLLSKDRFPANGLPIIISADSRLVSGRELLSAICRISKDVVVLVIRGVAYDRSVMALALGRPKSYSQICEALGAWRGELAVQVVKWIYFEQTGRPADRLRRFEIQELFLAHRRDLNPSLRFAHDVPVASVDPGLAAFLHFRFGQICPPLRDWFWAGLSHPQTLPFDDMRGMLREVLNRQPTPYHKAALCIKTWNAAREGRRSPDLFWDSSTETFPKIT